MQTIRDALGWGTKELEKKGVIDARLSAEILLRHTLGKSKTQFIQSMDLEFSEKQSNKFKVFIEKRSKQTPVAYIVGEKEFYSLDFYVDENVLIPRPETERIVDWFGEIIGNQPLRICDLGTGSGAIAITIKKQFPLTKVTAIDLSANALTVAKKNAKRHHTEIQFYKSDLLDGVKGPFDVIISNLPYVASHDLTELSTAVHFEPKLALDGGSEGLEIYKRLIPQLKKNLTQSGHVFVEYGVGQTENLKFLFQQQKFSVIEVRKDYAGIDRHMHVSL